MQDILTDVLPLLAPFLAGKFVFIPAEKQANPLRVIYGDFLAEVDPSGRFSIRQHERLVKSGEAGSLPDALNTVLHLLPTYQMEISGLAEAA